MTSNGISSSTEPIKKDKRKKKKKVDSRQQFVFEIKQKSLIAKKAASKIAGARFRWINEKLYTCTGQDALKLFAEDPSLFTLYHDGFQEQVSKWPQNPLDSIIDYIKTLPTESVIVDFGCGEARLAQSVPHKVHSFDFVASNEHVTACDMSSVPLPNNSIDVGVFCLSLMGTNLFDYISEARRVLKKNGVLKICEIKSRVSSLDDLVDKMKAFGFKLHKKDLSNKMFIDMEFVLRHKKDSTALEDFKLKPCLYKKR